MEARITFYKINRCGLYLRSEQTALFLNAQELLDDLKQWVTGKTLSETDVFKNKNNNGFCTYLADIKMGTDSVLLVMWNQIPNTESGVLSLPNNSLVGHITHADSNSIKKNSIPGYPTYFWFVPSKNIFATICFNTIVNGRSNMEDYVRQFMKVFSKHVVKELDEKNNLLTIKGYSLDPNNSEEKIYEYPPSFKSQRYPLLQKLQELIDRAPEIKKMTKKATAEYKTKLSKDLFQHILSFFKRIKRTPLASDIFTIKTEISINKGLTSKEVQELYDEWVNDKDSLRSLDYGFKLNDGKQLWFSHSLAKWEGELSLSFTEQNSFGNMDKLLSELESKRNTILSKIK